MAVGGSVITCFQVGKLLGCTQRPGLEPGRQTPGEDRPSQEGALLPEWGTLRGRETCRSGQSAPLSVPSAATIVRTLRRGEERSACGHPHPPPRVPPTPPSCPVGAQATESALLRKLWRPPVQPGDTEPFRGTGGTGTGTLPRCWRAVPRSLSTALPHPGRGASRPCHGDPGIVRHCPLRSPLPRASAPPGVSRTCVSGPRPQGPERRRCSRSLVVAVAAIMGPPPPARGRGGVNTGFREALRKRWAPPPHLPSVPTAPGRTHQGLQGGEKQPWERQPPGMALPVRGHRVTLCPARSCGRSEGPWVLPRPPPQGRAHPQDPSRTPSVALSPGTQSC